MRRVCLLPEDIDRYGLHGVTYPVSDKDEKRKRFPWDGPCCELEAIGDDQIPLRIREEIEKVLDIDAIRITQAKAAADKIAMSSLLSDHGLDSEL